MTAMYAFRVGAGDWISNQTRRWLTRITMAMFGRWGIGGGLNSSQRRWLLADSTQYLEALTEGIEVGGLDRATAEAVVTVSAVVRWLEGRGARPGAAAVAYLEKNLALIYRRPTEHELFQRRVYLTAIGEFGGDEKAAEEIWRGATDFARGTAEEAWAFQGRKLRALMVERGLSVTELVDLSGIEIEVLIPILFGLDELRYEEAVRLAGALGVEPERFSEGVRFVPNPDGLEPGRLEIDFDLDVPDLDPIPPAAEPRLDADDE